MTVREVSHNYSLGMGSWFVLRVVAKELETRIIGILWF